MKIFNIFRGGSLSRASRNLSHTDSSASRCCNSRKYAASLLFTIASFTAFAQTDSLHLTFKGIPIDGPIHEFIQKMAAVGFTYNSKSEDNSTFFFKGYFAGVNNCIIAVTPNSVNIVNSVVISFPDYNDWESVETNYNYLKSLLSKRYGEPYGFVEEFKTEVTPTESIEKMYCLKTEKATFHTLYCTYKGDISISIMPGVTGAHVFMMYKDRINSNTIKDNDVLNDL